MLVSLVCPLLLSLTTAQEPTVPQQVKVGGNLPGSIVTYNVTGAKKKFFDCPITANADNPVAMVIIHGLSDLNAFANLLTQLELRVTNEKNARDVRFNAFVVVYVDDLQKTDEKGLETLLRKDDRIEEIEPILDAMSRSAKLDKVIVTLTNRKLLKGYLPDESALGTVILYKDNKVESVFILPNAEAVRDKTEAILKDVGEKLGAKN